MGSLLAQLKPEVLKHVMSFRRQVFMFLNQNQNQNQNELYWPSMFTHTRNLL